jgi:hypothetical protein
METLTVRAEPRNRSIQVEMSDGLVKSSVRDQRARRQELRMRSAESIEAAASCEKRICFAIVGALLYKTIQNSMIKLLKTFSAHGL